MDVRLQISCPTYGSTSLVSLMSTEDAIRWFRSLDPGEESDVPMNKVELDIVGENSEGSRTLSVTQLESEGQNWRPRGERGL